MTFPSVARAGRLVPLLCALGVAACEFPSEPPIFEQTWIVPGDSVELGVAELLPDSVAVLGGAFVVTTPTASFEATLGELCGQPECQNPAPLVVPNTPAFTYSGAQLNSSISLPGDVNSITVSGGTLQIQVTNNIGFDPLRPNGVGGPHGSIAIAISSGALNSNTVIGGATQPMPNGVMTTLNVPVPTGVYTGPVSVALTLTVPQGGAATVASGNLFELDASIVGFTVSSATVVLNAQSVSGTPTAFDLDDVDLGDVVQGGGLILEIVNPFNASAALNMVLAAPAQGGAPLVNISKAVNVAANATSNANIAITKTELESLLGKTGVTINVSGSATGAGLPGNTVTVTPTQVIKFRSKLSITVQIGGDL